MDHTRGQMESNFVETYWAETNGHFFFQFFYLFTIVLKSSIHCRWQTKTEHPLYNEYATAFIVPQSVQ